MVLTDGFESKKKRNTMLNIEMDIVHVVGLAVGTYLVLAEPSKYDMVVLASSILDFLRIHAVVCIVRYLHTLTSFQISALYMSVVLVNRVVPWFAFLVLCPVLFWPNARWAKLSAGRCRLC